MTFFSQESDCNTLCVCVSLVRVLLSLITISYELFSKQYKFIYSNLYDAYLQRHAAVLDVSIFFLSLFIINNFFAIQHCRHTIRKVHSITYNRRALAR